MGEQYVKTIHHLETPASPAVLLVIVFTPFGPISYMATSEPACVECFITNFLLLLEDNRYYQHPGLAHHLSNKDEEMEVFIWSRPPFERH